EVVRAIIPMLRLNLGKLICITSPYMESGVAYEWHKQYFGDAGGHDVLVIQTDTLKLNPTTDEEDLESEERLDREAARSEIHGLCRSGKGKLLDAKDLAGCVMEGRLEVRPDKGKYFGFVDPSSLRGDAFTYGVATVDEDKNVVLVALGGYKAGSGKPSEVIKAISREFDRYGVREVQGDRNAIGLVIEEFDKNGITYIAVEGSDGESMDKSEIYIEFLHLVNQGAVRLLDHADMLREVRNLIRKPSPGGKDRVDHPSGGHDDYANAGAGACVLAALSI